MINTNCPPGQKKNWMGSCVQEGCPPGQTKNWMGSCENSQQQQYSQQPQMNQQSFAGPQQYSQQPMQQSMQQQMQQPMQQPMQGDYPLQGGKHKYSKKRGGGSFLTRNWLRASSRGRSMSRRQQGGTVVPYCAKVWNQQGSYPAAVGGGVPIPMHSQSHHSNAASVQKAGRRRTKAKRHHKKRTHKRHHRRHYK